MIYPKGGFKRATRYVIHRMSRLPDDPHRIARGVFAGFLVGFLPLPGLQFVAAWAAARLVRGNLFAALLGTFNTNPLTTPFFAVFAMTLGHWIMGVQEPLSAEAIGGAFAHAGGDLWRNFSAIFTPEPMHWGGLIRFWHEIYVPYFIGALLPGLLISAVAYYLTIPLVTTYQKARAAKADDRRERRHRLKLAVSEAKNRILHRADHDPVTKEGESRAAKDDSSAGAN